MISERPYSFRRAGTVLRRALRRAWVSGKRSLDPAFVRALRKPAPLLRNARSEAEARLRAALAAVQSLPVRTRALTGVGVTFAVCIASFGAQSLASRPAAPGEALKLETHDALGMGGPLIAENGGIEPASAGVTLLAASTGQVGSKSARPCTPKRELIEALGSVEEGQEIEQPDVGQDFAEGLPGEPGGLTTGGPGVYAFNTLPSGGGGGGSGGGPGVLPPSSPPGPPNGDLVPPVVPEPATWAMMILGFGAIGATLRRRRSGAVARS